MIAPRAADRPVIACLTTLVVFFAVLVLMGAWMDPAQAANLLDDLRPSLMLDAGVFAPQPGMAPALATPADMPWFQAPLNPRNALLILHLVGLSIGFGGAIVLDSWLLVWMVRGRQSSSVGAAFQLIGSVVAVGLVLLWVSGLGFLLLYALTDPEKLANPKIYGKIGIVFILSLNGYALHRWVMPMTLKDVRQPLFSGATIQARMIGLFCGALSAASWLSAFLLGLLKELNGRISVVDIVQSWSALVILAFLGANVLLFARAGFRTVVPSQTSYPSTRRTAGGRRSTDVQQTAPSVG